MQKGTHYTAVVGVEYRGQGLAELKVDLTFYQLKNISGSLILMVSEKFSTHLSTSHRV